MGLFSLSLIECAEQVAMSLGSHEYKRVILGGTLTNLDAWEDSNRLPHPKCTEKDKRGGRSSVDSLGGTYQND